MHFLGQAHVLDEELRLARADGFAVLGVGVGERLVACCLPRLCEQDERRRVGGLEREREVEQDKRVWVEVNQQLEAVEYDPERDENRLADEVLGRAEKTGYR